MILTIILPMSSKKGQTPMEKITQGYDKFIKGKELNADGKKKFDKTIKKAAKSKKGRETK